jgi:glycosyltransferase involved in cell wall biosynthesis
MTALGKTDAGGQNVHVADLATALARRGHEVRVYTRRESPEIAETVPFHDGVLVVHVPAGPAEILPKDDLLPHMPEFGAWLASRWQDGWQPDVVHAHFWMSGLAALEAAEAYPAPIALTYHALGAEKHRYQGADDTSPPERIELETTLGKRVDAVIAQCEHERDELTAMGVPDNHIVICHSGVDTDLFSPSGSQAPHEHPLVLSVGRLVPRKAYDDLIRALPTLPDAELVIAGGPPADELDTHPYARELRQLAEQLEVADRMRLLGSVSRTRLPAWYRAADVVASVPWYEPFGLTPLEAMACGTPVLATSVGGLAESVVDGRTGVLVPSGDQQALTTGLQSLLEDERLRHKYGQAGIDRIAKYYLWDHTAAELEEVYHQVMPDASAVH